MNLPLPFDFPSAETISAAILKAQAGAPEPHTGKCRVYVIVDTSVDGTKYALNRLMADVSRRTGLRWEAAPKEMRDGALFIGLDLNGEVLARAAAIANAIMRVRIVAYRVEIAE